MNLDFIFLNAQYDLFAFKVFSYVKQRYLGMNIGKI